MNVVVTVAAGIVLVLFLNWLAVWLFWQMMGRLRNDTVRSVRAAMGIVTVVALVLGFVLGGGRP